MSWNHNPLRSWQSIGHGLDLIDITANMGLMDYAVASGIGGCEALTDGYATPACIALIAAPAAAGNATFFAKVWLPEFKETFGL